MTLRSASLFLSFLLAPPAPAGALPRIGEPAPPLALRDLQGREFLLSRWVGPTAKEHKVVLLDFFATWCKPCRRELAVFKKIHETWGTRGVEVVLVGYYQDEETLTEVAGEKALPFRVLADRYGVAAKRYGVSSIPRTFLVDREGRVALIVPGEQPDLEGLLDSALRKAVGK